MDVSCCYDGHQPELFAHEALQYAVLGTLLTAHDKGCRELNAINK